MSIERKLELTFPNPCSFCGRAGKSPEDPIWGVVEKFTYSYSDADSIYSGQQTNVLAEKVSLFEAQAIYAGQMQKPLPSIDDLTKKEPSHESSER